MAEISSMAPVYFARRQQMELSDEDYDASVAQNENTLNENFKTLYDWISEISTSVSALQAK